MIRPCWLIWDAASKRPGINRARTAVGRLLTAGDTLFTSRINEAELRVGVEMASDRERELLRVERILGALGILEFTSDAALRYAVIKATLQRLGRPSGDCDAMVAAIALANGQSLLTRNPRHFSDVPGLAVLNY